jgi:hypothetical protein
MSECHATYQDALNMPVIAIFELMAGMNQLRGDK